MGMLIEGRWCEEDRTIQNGAYVRPPSPYDTPLDHGTIRAIESEPGRFHLIASLSCPWSHRATLTRLIKGLVGHIPLHIAGGPRTQGYRVGPGDRPWRVPGTDRHIEHLHDLYTLADPTYTGRATVAVLWDAARRVIVSNESVRILRGLDAVRAGTGAQWTLRPPALAGEIDALSDHLQSGLSNAVYRAGKARRQGAYDEAVREVFATLERLEARLAGSRYLHGSVLTETDIRLWPTLARFDAVYHGHFKCSRRRLTDYDALWRYARDIYAWPGVAGTLDDAAIRAAYYGEDRDLNPFGIVATAPIVDWAAPHGRERLGERQVTSREGSREGQAISWNAVEGATGAKPPQAVGP